MLRKSGISCSIVGLWLLQTEHIHVQLGQSNSVTANQIMMYNGDRNTLEVIHLIQSFLLMWYVVSIASNKVYYYTWYINDYK
jgi:hypothetical protein